MRETERGKEGESVSVCDTFVCKSESERVSVKECVMEREREGEREKGVCV